jgi:transposase
VRSPAGQAGQVLASVTPAGAVDAARWELAAELTEDLRGAGARIRQTRKKAAVAVRAAGTSLTGLFGVGPVIAAAVIGDVRHHVSRFGNRDRFAAYNGTAPIEVSSGGRKACRLSRRGNRRLNHAIHMAAVTQIRYRHTKGRACYDKKLAEGKTPKEALRALKRQISDAIFACLQEDARRAAAAAKSPGGQPGNHSASRAAGSHPDHRLFGQATPGPAAQPTTPPAAPFPALLPSRASERPGSRTGRSPAAQRRPQGVLDAAAREPTMPAAEKGGRAAQRKGSHSAGGRSCTASALTLDFETKR